MSLFFPKAYLFWIMKFLKLGVGIIGLIFSFTGLGLVSFSGIAYAKPKVALMTSIQIREFIQNLSSEKKIEFERSLDGFPTYFEMLEAQVKTYFPSELYDAEFFHNVDQYQVAQVLQSPYDALFWLSHGGFCPSRSPSDVSEGIVDRLGFNITPLFLTLNPATRFVGVVSCGSKFIFDKLFELFDFPIPPQAKWKTFETKVDGKPGLLAVLEAGKTELDRAAREPLATSSPTLIPLVSSGSGLFVQIVRECVLAPEQQEQALGSAEFIFPALRVESDSGFPIMTLPSCRLGERVEATGWLRSSESSGSLVVQTGSRFLPAPFEIAMGEFKVTSIQNSAGWKLFLNRKTGRPVGLDSRTFHFLGKWPVETSAARSD